MRTFLTFALLTSVALCGVRPVLAQTTERKDLARFFKGYDAAAFVMTDPTTGKTVCYNPTRCEKRFSPCSTFKIPNSLIALETGVVSGPDHKFHWDGTQYQIKDWNHDQTLKSAMEFSVVWCFQEIASMVGAERMQSYISKFGYGNQKTAGDLTHFWLNGTLGISANEQVAFLTRFYNKDLPLKATTMATVKSLLVTTKVGNVTLRGKTGTGGSLKNDEAVLGWWVGYAEVNGKTYIIATNISGARNAYGREARRITGEILTKGKVL